MSSTVPGRILITCPATGAVVSTVLRLRPAAFEILSGEYSFRCERCGQIHSWSRADAWIEPTGRPPAVDAPVTAETP